MFSQTLEIPLDMFIGRSLDPLRLSAFPAGRTFRDHPGKVYLIKRQGNEPCSRGSNDFCPHPVTPSETAKLHAFRAFPTGH